MTFDQDGIKLEHTEALAWVEWFLLEQTRRGIAKNLKDQIGATLFAFLDSGPAYLTSLSKTSIKCPKCQGRGHSNLFLAGSAKPLSCNNCDGTGTIEPNIIAMPITGLDVVE